VSCDNIAGSVPPAHEADLPFRWVLVVMGYGNGCSEKFITRPRIQHALEYNTPSNTRNTVLDVCEKQFVGKYKKCSLSFPLYP